MTNVHRRIFDERAAAQATSAMTASSPECMWHRSVGELVSNTITLTGGAGAKTYDVFTFSGAIEIKALYAVVTTATQTTTMSAASFQWHDGTDPHDLTDDVDMSGAAAGSVIAKSAAAAAAASFINASTGGLIENATAKPVQDSLLVAKTGATNKIKFHVTQDEDTSAVLTVYCAWVCRSAGSSVTAA